MWKIRECNPIEMRFKGRPKIDGEIKCKTTQRNKKWRSGYISSKREKFGMNWCKRTKPMRSCSVSNIVISRSSRRRRRRIINGILRQPVSMQLLCSSSSLNFDENPHSQGDRQTIPKRRVLTQQWRGVKAQRNEDYLYPFKCICPHQLSLRRQGTLKWEQVFFARIFDPKVTLIHPNIYRFLKFWTRLNKNKLHWRAESAFGVNTLTKFITANLLLAGSERTAWREWSLKMARLRDEVMGGGIVIFFCHILGWTRNVCVCVCLK